MKRIKTNSLRFQLLSRSLLLIAGLLVIIGLFQYIFMRGFIYQNKAQSIQSQILSIPIEAWEKASLFDEMNLNLGGSPEDNAFEIKLPHIGPSRVPFFFLPDSTIAFYDTNGTLSVLSNSSKDGEAPPKLDDQDYQNALSSKHDLTYKIIDPASGNEQLIVLQSVKNRDQLLGVVQVSLDTKPLRDILTRQLLTFLLIALLALIGGMLAYIPVLKKTLIPLSKMVDTVEKVDAGNLAERLPVDQGQEEIDRLADSFNGMLERLEISFAAEKEAKEQMRRFVADASHELRTPLTSIHGFLEVLLRGAMNQPDKLHRSLTSMYDESERMKKLVQDLLLLAKLDRSPNVQLSEGVLDEIIKGMAPQLRVLAGNRKVSLKLTSDLKCCFEEDKLKQVILNLFHNAVQHTDPEQGEILISLESAPGGVQLSVQDNGSGIPPEHLPKLFDRFYRSDSSRTRKYGGAGLGLAISKSLVDLHGGTIRVESKDEEGTAFYVWLPQYCEE
ncbi:signal transduction histidine kinase [Desulfosporosinus orientis DSM 765]|uniref:histidine kinase n=1 Tax=Desulfosporosinus orientis (strain ATCC 19365 / DSM 765 / NCIMB 8382 / VKM B-1628 / Singapore I) TaxID=768706 RepID=G7WIL4_DESOD|nr:HAMP domain-containing sensor histidine kinase [Desulfosporosinus orientis]AET69088.1 signal transduction histidine kinase [Desulfosporosinus orientis DSM 765]